MRKINVLFRTYWLAERGLAPKRALFVVIPLIIFFLIEHVKYVLKRKAIW